MKKGILILGTILAAFSLAAIGYVNGHQAVNEEKTAPTACTKNSFDADIVYTMNPSMVDDLIYKIDSRFIHRITKTDIEKAISIADLLPEEATKSIVSYENAWISIIEEEKEAGEAGKSDVLTLAQKQLLEATDYTSNIAISSDHTIKVEDTEELRKSYLRYSTSIVPEQIAAYTEGTNVLIAYLKANSRGYTAAIIREQLRPCRVNFTVNKTGKIADVKLTSSSGYPTVDEVLVDLINNMPGTWTPATNAAGEYVDQELVFFFGTDGC